MIVTLLALLAVSWMLLVGAVIAAIHVADRHLKLVTEALARVPVAPGAALPPREEPAPAPGPRAIADLGPPRVPLATEDAELEELNRRALGRVDEILAREGIAAA